MAITKIPERHRPGIVKIKNLSKESVDALTAALESAPTDSSLAELKSHAVSIVKSIDELELQEIISTLYSLYLTSDFFEGSQNTLLSDLMRAMRATGRADLLVSVEEKPGFEARMARLLGIRALSTLAKSDALKLEFERTFCDVRIISDIRPVFSRPEEKPISAVVMHTLRIGFHGSRSDHEEFYIGLDDEDLTKLKQAVERAQKKSATLKTMLRESGIAGVRQ